MRDDQLKTLVDLVRERATRDCGGAQQGILEVCEEADRILEGVPTTPTQRYHVAHRLQQFIGGE